MSIYNIHAGHCPQGMGAFGAVGLLKESVENRLVKDELIRLLRSEGHTVYDCTVNYCTTQSKCLADIVKLCNKHNVNLDVSIHLNSGRNDYSGDGNTGGTEVFNYDTRTKAISDRICANISDALGIRNRGTKYSKSLYVLNNTKSPALLVECCFVDDKDDAQKWDYRKCAKAIAEGILGRALSSSTSVSGSAASSSLPEKPELPAGTSAGKTSSSQIHVKYQVFSQGKWLPDVLDYNTVNTDGYAGILGSPVMALRANTSGTASAAGYLEYRAHRLGGNWYQWQRDRQKDTNGENFAGTCTSRIDGLQMRLISCPGHSVKYRVHTLGKGWLPWVTGYGSGADGYAGWYGFAVDAVQIQIV